MAKRVDSNHTQVVKELRQMGYSVESTHEVGSGRPDIMVGKYGFNFWIEIKDPKKPPSKRKLRPNQQDWHKQWQGHKFVGHTAEEIHEHIKFLISRMKYSSERGLPEGAKIPRKYYIK